MVTTVRKTVRKTLPGAAYHSDETYAVDRERVFYRNWIYVGRAERVPTARRLDAGGDRRREPAGRPRQGRADPRASTTSAGTAARASATTSRAPCAATCAAPTTRGATPSTGRWSPPRWSSKDEIDRPSTSLWPVHVDVWEGFVFVNLSREEPRPLLEHLADQQDDALGLARVGLADLRIGHVSTIDVQANWKIVIENYNECLHCPTIHPELVAVVPAYKKG